MGADHDTVERWSRFKVWLFSLISRDTERGAHAVDHMKLNQDDRFLDIGCGLGGALQHALRSGASVAGVDPSPTMVEKAGTRARGAVVKEGSAEKIPFPDDSFTAVLSMASFHHWADPEAGLDEIARVLAPRGRLLIAEKALKKSGHGLTPDDAARLVGDLTGRGFEDVKVSEINIGRHDALAVTATLVSG